MFVLGEILGVGRVILRELEEGDEGGDCCE